ncbi:MAG: DUF3038 domain-containing protein [Phormidesmis sp.]
MSSVPINNPLNNPLIHHLPADSLSTAQLSSIKAQLDLVLMAIESLTNIGSEAVLAAAKDLQLQEILSDRVGLWRLRQSSPLRKGQGRKKLDIEEARALVLVVCHLATSYHDKIRQAVAKLEQVSANHEPPHRAAVLGDYLDSFNNLYCDRMSDPVPKTDDLTQLSLRLLIDLLFYSAPGGERQLWLALLERAEVRSGKRLT